MRPAAFASFASAARSAFFVIVRYSAVMPSAGGFGFGVGGRFRAHLLGQPLHQRAELQLVEQRLDALAVEAPQPALIDVKLDRRVAADRRLVLAEQRLLLELAQLLPQLLRRHLRDRRVDALDAPELLDQLRRRLLADARHARDVVRRVALQPLVVGNLRRLEVVSLAHAVSVVGDRRRGLDVRPVHEHVDARLDELQQVAVERHERHRNAALLRLLRERAQHVVRFVARHFEDRHVERLEHLPDAPALPLQLVGHRRARRLVRLVASERNVLPGASSATARCVGLSSVSTLSSVLVKP